MYPDVNRRRFRKGEKEIRIVARRWMLPLWAIVKRTLRRQSPVAIATSQEPCDGWIIVWEKFLFSSSPLPPSLPLTCSHFHSSPGPVCWMLASYRIFLDLIRPSFSLSCFVCVCAVKFELQPGEDYQTTVAVIARCYLAASELFENFICLRGERCAPKALSQPVILLSTFQRLCCQTMVLPPRPLALRICNA